MGNYWLEAFYLERVRSALEDYCSEMTAGRVIERPKIELVEIRSKFFSGVGAGSGGWLEDFFDEFPADRLAKYAAVLKVRWDIKEVRDGGVLAAMEIDEGYVVVNVRVDVVALPS